MFDRTHAQRHMGKIPRTHNVFKCTSLGLRLCVTRLDVVLPLCEQWIIENNTKYKFICKWYLESDCCVQVIFNSCQCGWVFMNRCMP